MSRARKYPWPTKVGEAVEIPARDDHERALIRTAASKFGNNRRWVLRARWTGNAVRVVRAA